VVLAQLENDLVYFFSFLGGTYFLALGWAVILATVSNHQHMHSHLKTFLCSKSYNWALIRTMMMRLCGVLSVFIISPRESSGVWHTQFDHRFLRDRHP
jgi:hypothetical protein